MEKVNVAMVCKLMPYYRLGVFQSLSAITETYEFSFFGDTKEQGGIKQIPFTYATAGGEGRIRWIKTRNYFYKPERLLWQTGIIKEIFRSKFKVFVFEGALAHVPIWLFALLCKLCGKKVVFWTHGNRGLDRGIKKFLRVVLFKWLGDGLFLYGHFQRNLMIEEGYDPKKLFVIYNSLQPDKQFKILKDISNCSSQENNETLFQSADNFTLIFIGRLVASKGVMNILKAIKTLKDTSILVNCIFIGEGEEKDKMLTYCATHELDAQVYFAGALYDEESIAPYFVKADLMMSPGNVGLNCIHALAYGVPVLTHNNFVYQNPEVEAIIDGKTGVFYQFNSMDDMLYKLKYWMENNTSKSNNTRDCQHVIKALYNPSHQAQCIVLGLNMILNGK